MTEKTDLIAKLHSETALIPWRELQRFFAQGVVIEVSTELDIVEIAAQFANDNAEKLKPLLDSKQVMPASDEHAREWIENDVSVWSVVVAPYVLVQFKNSDI